MTCTFSVSVAAAAPPTTSGRPDAEFHSMLSTMVHEANFLVENNLSYLVEEIDSKEQTLFKLDSILSVVGIEGETEVLKIIRDSLGPSQNAATNRDSILKAIRGKLLFLIFLVHQNFFLRFLAADGHFMNMLYKI